MKFIFLALVFYLPEHFDHLAKVGRLENQKKYEGGSNVELAEPKELTCFNRFFFFFNSSKQLVVICCSNLLLTTPECQRLFLDAGKHRWDPAVRQLCFQ